jgi:hypothetical protein
MQRAPILVLLLSACGQATPETHLHHIRENESSSEISDGGSLVDDGGANDDASARACAPRSEGNARAVTSMAACPAGTAGGLGPWRLSADYPLAHSHCAGTAPDLYCAEQTCVADARRAYCVGAASTSTYYAGLSADGIGPWNATADYPIAIEAPSCVIGSDHIYCVGGRIRDPNAAGSEGTADVYYAALSASGIETWKASTPFPRAAAPRCMADAGYLYCTSIWSAADGSLEPEAYYASISEAGVGAWMPTTALPSTTNACVALDHYAYCYGGGGCVPLPRTDCYSASYYAPLTASGIGAWKATTPLPAAVSANYVVAGSYVYYLSIPIFVASVSADGIGTWATTTNYPNSLYPSTCFSDGSELYCASPVPGSSYFAQVDAPNPQALRLEPPPPYPRSEYLRPAWNGRSGGAVEVNSVLAGAPMFGPNIDEAVVFSCFSQASTADGCRTTVASPKNTAYNYDLTIWYPCTEPGQGDTNCCFLPALGYKDRSYGWCSSVGPDSFIIAQQLQLQAHPMSAP